MPISYDYTLLEVANAFFPSIKSDGSPYQYYATYGFKTDLNDQIPFERAYELWKDNVFLKHSKKRDGSNYTPDEINRGTNRYTRDEIYEGIKRTVKTHLEAIQHIVVKLREKCGDQLILKKGAFSASPPTQIRLPQIARQLIIFQKLDAITHEIENRQQISLPVAEKEAKFISIRDLKLIIGNTYDSILEEIRQQDPRHRSVNLLAFTFSPNSKDALIMERDDLIFASNSFSLLSFNFPIFFLMSLGAMSVPARLMRSSTSLSGT